MSEPKGTQTRRADLQKFPFRQVALRAALALPAAFPAEKDRMVSVGFTHIIYSLLVKEWPGYWVFNIKLFKV